MKLFTRVYSRVQPKGVNFNQLNSIYKVLESRLPNTANILGAVKLKLNGRCPHTEFHYLENEGVTVMHQPRPDEYKNTLLISLPSKINDEKLVKGFLKSVLDWSSPLAFYGIDQRAKRIIEEIVDTKMGVIVRTMDFNYYTMPIEQAKNLQIKNLIDSFSEKFYIGNLNPSHAKVVASYWEYKLPGFEDYLKSTFTTMETVGLFRKDNHELISWIYNAPWNFINNHHTLAEYRRQGLGRVTLTAIVRKVAESNLIPNCATGFDNEASNRNIVSIGMKLTDIVTFVYYIPKS